MTAEVPASERDPVADLYETCGHLVDQLRHLERQLIDAHNMLAAVPTETLRVDELGPAATATDLAMITSDSLWRGQRYLQQADCELSGAWSAMGRLYTDSEPRRVGHPALSS